MKSFIMIISTLSLLGRKLLKLLNSKGERNGGQFKSSYLFAQHAQISKKLKNVIKILM